MMTPALLVDGIDYRPPQTVPIKLSLLRSLPRSRGLTPCDWLTRTAARDLRGSVLL